MIIIYHEEFLKNVTSKIKEINKLNQEGNKVEAAKSNLELAKYKVAYYEQFISDSAPITNYKKIHDDNYYWALMGLATARDKCMDLGIYEQFSLFQLTGLAHYWASFVILVWLIDLNKLPHTAQVLIKWYVNYILH